MPPAQRTAAALLGVAALVAAAALGHAWTSPRPVQPYTEFYWLSVSGDTGCYPATFGNGTYGPGSLAAADCPADVGSVTLGIVNHEGGPRDYTVRLRWSDAGTGGNATESVLWTVHAPSDDAPRDVGSTFTPQEERDLRLPPPPGTGPWRGDLLLDMDDGAGHHTDAYHALRFQVAAS